METPKEYRNVERAMSASSCAFPCSDCPLHNSHCAGNVQRKELRMTYSNEKERDALIGMASAIFG